DEPLGGSFHVSPPRSTQAPLVGHTSEGAKDLITLTVVSSIVSTLVQKLKDTKKLFKDVVGKLVKKVKAMRGKTKDQEKEGGSVTVDSNIPPGGASNNHAASSHIIIDVPTSGDFAPTYSTLPSRDPFK
ncbi:hypothetical protein Tco_0376325, partial [Tanacetum coccineum]